MIIPEELRELYWYKWRLKECCQEPLVIMITQHKPESSMIKIMRLLAFSLKKKKKTRKVQN